ncbi:hypothetical protein BBJ28_00015352, partial [Nothophytophthora sp. Chile5]
QSLMILRRQVKNSSTLAKATRLKPIKANATRWPSTFLKLQRYVKIRDAILTVNTVEEYVPRGNAHRRIVTLVDKLEELDSVCVKLQAEQRTLAEVRLLFNACVEKYPIMGEYLLPTAAIVHSPDFEDAVVKIQGDVPLSATEHRSVAGFVLPPTAPHPATATKDDFAATILRQAKKPRLSGRASVQYDMLVHSAPRTSNTCERLFSGCKLVLTSLRSSTLPANFERMVFLRANRDMWNSATLLGCIEE